MEAGSLPEALEKAQNEAPKARVNVAIIDGCLTPYRHVVNGNQVASLLRETVPGIKIIAISGLSKEEINFGDLYFPKPIDFQKLAEEITKI